MCKSTVFMFQYQTGTRWCDLFSYPYSDEETVWNRIQSTLENLRTGEVEKKYRIIMRTVVTTEVVVSE